MVEEMIASLDAAGKQDLLPLGYAFAALVFKKEDQREWLRKRFEMLRDILEESWAYQEMVQKGLQQGLQQGLEQGLQEGELRALRQAIVDVVQERFPEIVASVKKRVQTIEDTLLLRLVNVKMSTLPTAKEAQQYVRSIGKDRKDSYKSR